MWAPPLGQRSTSHEKHPKSKAHSTVSMPCAALFKRFIHMAPFPDNHNGEPILAGPLTWSPDKQLAARRQNWPIYIIYSTQMMSLNMADSIKWVGVPLFQKLNVLLVYLTFFRRSPFVKILAKPYVQATTHVVTSSLMWPSANDMQANQKKIDELSHFKLLQVPFL